MRIRIIDFPKSILWVHTIINSRISKEKLILTSISLSPFSLRISSACPFFPRFPCSSRNCLIAIIVSCALRSGHETANLLCFSRCTRQIGHGQSPMRPLIRVMTHLITGSTKLNTIMFMTDKTYCSS